MIGNYCVFILSLFFRQIFISFIPLSGAGVHVLMTEHGQEINDLLKQSASKNQGRSRKSSLKRSK